MLKVYSACNSFGEIILKNSINTVVGRYDSGTNGYGSVDVCPTDISEVNYVHTTLKAFEEYCLKVRENTHDGFVNSARSTNFYLNGKNYKMLEEEFKDVEKTLESYETYGLNEEAILLFTEWVNIKSENQDLVRKLFGRYP